MSGLLNLLARFFGLSRLRRRHAAKAAARLARTELYARAQAIIDGYDHPALAPAMERVAVSSRRRRRRGRPSRKAMLLASVLVTAATAAGVLAYYTNSGHATKTAAAAVGTVSDITLSDGTPSTALYPGGTADVALSIDNPNAVKVHIPSLVLDSGGIVVDGGHSGCNASKVHYTTQNNGGSGYDVQPGTHPLDLSGAISMDTDAASACQGASFTVYLKVGT